MLSIQTHDEILSEIAKTVAQTRQKKINPQRAYAIGKLFEIALAVLADKREKPEEGDGDREAPSFRGFPALVAAGGNGGGNGNGGGA